MLLLLRWPLLLVLVLRPYWLLLCPPYSKLLRTLAASYAARLLGSDKTLFAAVMSTNTDSAAAFASGPVDLSGWCFSASFLQPKTESLDIRKGCGLLACLLG